jgi:hypothetical protein
MKGFRCFFEATVFLDVETCVLYNAGVITSTRD